MRGETMKKYLRVGDLREFLNDCNIDDDTKIYIISNDDMPVRCIVDISSEKRVGYYNELYLDTIEFESEDI